MFLRVKLKSLAAESRIIRQEERRQTGIRYLLAEHRCGVVRSAARSTVLAYAFLRGRTYSQCESKAAKPPNWKEIERMVAQYGACMGGGESYDEFVKRKADQAERFKKWSTS